MLSVSNTQSISTPTRQTRKRFRPTQDETATLRRDQEEKTQSTNAERRATEFGVTKKQITDWHKRHKADGNR